MFLQHYQHWWKALWGKQPAKAHEGKGKKSQWLEWKGGRIREEWHPDRGGYLKAHLGWNRNFEQSQLKCGSSSKTGSQRTGRYGGGKWHKGEDGGKNSPPNHQSPRDTRPADIRRTNVHQIDCGGHFQLRIKARPAPKGLLAVNTKQIVIASLSWERDGEHRTKPKLKFCQSPCNRGQEGTITEEEDEGSFWKLRYSFEKSMFILEQM